MLRYQVSTCLIFLKLEKTTSLPFSNLLLLLSLLFLFPVSCCLNCTINLRLVRSKSTVCMIHDLLVPIVLSLLIILIIPSYFKLTTVQTCYNLLVQLLYAIYFRIVFLTVQHKVTSIWRNGIENCVSIRFKKVARPTKKKVTTATPRPLPRFRTMMI